MNGCAAGGEVAFDGVGEYGEVGVADDLAELLFGFEHPGGGPSEAHVAVCQCLTLPLVRRTISIIDSVGALQGALEAAADPKPGERQRLLEALAQRHGRAGMRSLKLAREGLEIIEREAPAQARRSRS